MILRKPYAFLIKHFKLIHIIILVCLSIMLLNLADISSLFRTLQSTSTYIYAGADVYINKSIYLFIIISLVLSSIVYYLFKVKNKPRRFYLFLIIYFLASLFCYMYIYRTMNMMIDNSLDSEIIILVKDLSLLLSLPGYVFILICFIRGIGFNIKKFNFSKDLDDLKISEKDREEFEFTLGQNNYKYMRTFRRTIREFKYYVLENKFAISMICLGIVIVLTISGIYYYNGYLKKLSESESSSVNGITYTVNNSYITANDSNGEMILKDYKFVIVDLSLYNSTSLTKTLDLEKIVLANGKLIYNPTLTMNAKFYDLGKPYQEKQILLPNTISNATLTFQIPKTVKNNNFTLKVQYSLEGKYKNFKANYKNFDVNAKNIDTEEINEEHKINEEIKTNVVDKNFFAFTIKSYLIKDSYSSKYVRCSNESDCKLLSSLITLDMKTSSITNTMMIIDYDAIVNNDNNFYKSLNTYDKIFGNYLTVVYKIGDKIKREKAIIKDSKEIDNKLFVEVNREIVNADQIYLQFDFRNNNYIVDLK